MVTIKTENDIKILQEGGKILARILRQVAKQVKLGVKTSELNSLAEKLIQDAGGEPAFKGVLGPKDPFPCALCVSINEQVVHGIPSNEIVIKDGDLVGLDLGLKYKGLFTDMAVTVGVGKVDKRARKMMQVTKKALDLAIKKIKPGVDLQEVSAVIEKIARKNDFQVVRQLVGHGVGYDVHEPPQIPNYVIKDFHLELKPGMVLALEPMFTMGDWKVKTLSDGWTAVTADGSKSAHFEHTVVVTDKGALIVTK